MMTLNFGLNYPFNWSNLLVIACYLKLNKSTKKTFPSIYHKSYKYSGVTIVNENWYFAEMFPCKL